MDCDTFPELELSDWSQSLLAKLQGRRYPFSGTLELNERCNMNCVHCYINQPAADGVAKARELSTSQVKHILDQMASAGCLYLLLTGGEILLRADFAEIYRHAHQRGMILSLFTNATLVTTRVADLLAEWRPHLIDITLYGATRETYEKVTRLPGSYDRCMQGIHLLLERRLPVTLKSVLMKSNLHELSQMRALADELGVTFRYDGLLWPRLDGSQAPLEQQVTVEDLLLLDREDPKRQAEWVKMADSFIGQKPRTEFVYSCGAGYRNFHVDSRGWMSLCTMSRKGSQNLLATSFEQAWEALGKIRQAKRSQVTDCQTCTIGGLCMQCPGWSQAVHNDDETPVAFLCELGHRRAAQTRSAQIEL